MSEFDNVLKQLDQLDGKLEATIGMVTDIATVSSKLQARQDGLDDRVDILDDLLKVAMDGTIPTEVHDVEIPDDDDETLTAQYPDMAGGLAWELKAPVFTNKILMKAADDDEQTPLMLITADHATTWEMIYQISKNSQVARMTAMWGSGVGPGSFHQFRWFDPAKPLSRGVWVPNLYCGIEMLHFKKDRSGFFAWASKSTEGAMIDFSLHQEHRQHKFTWQQFFRFQQAWIKNRDEMAAVGHSGMDL